MAKQYADVTNEHVIEDLIDVNYGIDEIGSVAQVRDRDGQAVLRWLT